MERVERLDHFLDSEINETESCIMSTKNANYLTAACKTKRSLEAIRRDFCEKEKGRCEMEKYLSLSKINIADDFIKFVLAIANEYAKYPLSETESSKKIPYLPTRKYITNEEIITFLNEIYNDELKSKNIIRFNEGNIRIFQNSFLHKKFTKLCVPYHNYHELYSILILNKYDNVNNLIIPASKAIELLPEIQFRSYDNIINIMTYYMKYRAMAKIRDEYNQVDAINYYRMSFERLIIDARQIILMFRNKKWNELSNYQQSCVLNFIDNALGAYIADNENISLKDMVNIIGENGNIFDMDSFNLSPDSIFSGVKELAYKSL
jgi:hypothetical protein